MDLGLCTSLLNLAKRICLYSSRFKDTNQSDILLCRYWYLCAAFPMWNPSNYLFLTNVIHRGGVYIPANSFKVDKAFGEDFFKLLAIYSGLKSILSLNWTCLAISHVYKGLHVWGCLWLKSADSWAYTPYPLYILEIHYMQKPLAVSTFAPRLLWSPYTAHFCSSPLS